MGDCIEECLQLRIEVSPDLPKVGYSEGLTSRAEKRYSRTEKSCLVVE